MSDIQTIYNIVSATSIILS